MELTVLDNVRKRFLYALNALVGFLKNSTARKKRIKKSISSPLNYKKKLTLKKGELGYKGSAYRGKGSVNKDAAIFNRLRKEEHRGRLH